jgi:hypothetical protein
MSNDIIDLQAVRQAKYCKINRQLAYVVDLILARNQSIVVGTCKPQERYWQLKAMFPEAELEILPIGIGIKNGKSK